MCPFVGHIQINQLFSAPTFNAWPGNSVISVCVPCQGHRVQFEGIDFRHFLKVFGIACEYGEIASNKNIWVPFY